MTLKLNFHQLEKKNTFYDLIYINLFTFVFIVSRVDIFLIQWHVYVKTRSMDNEFHLSTIENFRTNGGQTDPFVTTLGKLRINKSCFDLILKKKKRKKNSNLKL